MNDMFKISGYVKLYEFPQNYTYDDIRNLSEDQKDVFLVDAGKNLVVDTGLTQIIDLMVGTDTSSFTHCRVGSGTNTPTNADTDMQTIIDSGVTVTNRYKSGLTANFETFFGTTTNNGTWNETGIANAATGSDLLCRRKFAAAFTKATTNTALIAWIITFEAVAD